MKEEGCPEAREIFLLRQSPSSLSEERRRELELHLAWCDLCAEDYSDLVDRLSVPMPEPTGEGVDILQGLPARLRDMKDRYPDVKGRFYSVEGLRRWARRLMERWSDLVDLSLAGSAELTPAALRAGISDDVRVEEISGILSRSRRLSEEGDELRAADGYRMMGDLLGGTPQEKRARFWAGALYLRCGRVEDAVEQLTASIGEEAGEDVYWFLALAMISKGDLGDGVRYLQTVEGMGGRLREKAARLLDDIEKA